MGSNLDRRSEASDTVRRRLARLGAALLVACASVGATTAPKPETFPTPDDAVAALEKAVADPDPKALLRLFGPDATKIVSSGDPVADAKGREAFQADFAKAHRIDADGDARAVLVVGEDGWPFPIPIVKLGDAWRFDAKAGEEEILDRRIGRNEHAAIEVCLAYGDAQREYASKDRDGDGLLSYARKFVSSPGKHDGLYWPVQDGEPESPLGPAVAEARAEGYGAATRAGEHEPYHGYFYKILEGQGPHAPGGAYDYVARDHMIGGFAIVAYPAQYGASGVMTFLMNHEGVVYQKDLGPKTAAIVAKMTRFDPDASWAKVPARDETPEAQSASAAR